MGELPDGLDIATLAACRRRGLTPTALARAVLDRIAAYPDDAVWIHRVPEAEVMARAAALEARGPQGLPLYGVPFAVKDNIDVAGLPTTAACPAYSYVPAVTAPAVQRLLDAGALLVGKTNLDQFATGLVGVRSPYGICRNAIDPAYVPGGSSAGSAVAVAAGLASFALGTDTAGSGRIPAAFNNVVGLKPTRGLVSTRGVVPACRTLDCVSVFAMTCADAAAVLDIIAGFDPADPFARPPAPTAALPPGGIRVGVPRASQLAFFDNPETPRLFAEAVARLTGLGAVPVEIDFAPFADVAALLYGGPWVAERYAAIKAFLESSPEAVHPVTRQIIDGAKGMSAADAFAGLYRLEALRRAIAPVWADIDVLATPTAGTIYTVEQVLAEPLQLNTNLGFYTNFMNLLDLCAVAVPSGRQGNGLPFGITLSAPAFRDRGVLALAERYHAATGLPLGAGSTPLPQTGQQRSAAVSEASEETIEDTIKLAVCGAHMAGLPLNPELTRRGGVLAGHCRTAPAYRLYALPGTPPARPGLVRTASGGAAIEVEVWALPAAKLGEVIAKVPAPLAIGTVELDTGERVKGFLCEGYAAATAADITGYGGWRAFLMHCKERNASKIE